MQLIKWKEMKFFMIEVLLSLFHHLIISSPAHFIMSSLLYFLVQVLSKLLKDIEPSMTSKKLLLM